VKQLQNEALQRPDLAAYKASDKIPVIVVLDNVRSGLNVGAIFRTCDAFSIEAIYLCGISVQPPHTEIMKTALGATESVTWYYFEKADVALREIKDKHYKLIAVEQTDSSQSLGEIDFKSNLPLALIFGNEMRKSIFLLTNLRTEANSLFQSDSERIIIWLT